MPIRIDGLNQLVRGMVKAGVEVDDLKDAFSEIAKQGAVIVARKAAPRSQTVSASVRGNRAKNKAVVSAGGARVKRAGSLNWGWPAGKKNWKAIPRKRGGWPIGIKGSMFMAAADEELEPVALQLLDTELTRLIRRNGLG